MHQKEPSVWCVWGCLWLAMLTKTMLTMLYIMLCSSITTHSVYTSRYTEVFSGGGWQMKVGSLKKCAVYFKSNPTKLHECLVSICSVAMYCMTVDVYLISMFLRIRDTDTCSLFFWGGDEVAAPARSSNPFQKWKPRLSHSFSRPAWNKNVPRNKRAYNIFVASSVHSFQQKRTNLCVLFSTNSC